MRYLLGTVAGIILGATLTLATQRYAPAILWALFARGDER